MNLTNAGLITSIFCILLRHSGWHIFKCEISNDRDILFLKNGVAKSQIWLTDWTITCLAPTLLCGKTEMWKRKYVTHNEHSESILFEWERVFCKALLNNFPFTLPSLTHSHNKNQECPNEHVYFKNNRFINLSICHLIFKGTFILKLKTRKKTLNRTRCRLTRDINWYRNVLLGLISLVLLK